MKKFEINENQLAAVIELLSTAAHSRPFNQVATVISGLQKLPSPPAESDTENDPEKES